MNEISFNNAARVVFRTIGSHDQGLGHFTRCSKFAKNLESKGIKTLFLVDGDEDGIAFLEDRGMNIVMMSYSNNAIEETKRIRRSVAVQKADVLIYDVWNCSSEIFSAMQLCRNVVVFDIVPRAKLYIDLYVNGIKNNLQNKIYNCGNSTVIEGPQAIIMDPEYAIAHSSQRNPALSVERILLSFGGSDPRNLTMKVLKVLYPLCKSKGWIIDLVIGRAYQHRFEIKEWIYGKESTIFIHDNLSHLANIMMKANLAICAGGGGTIHELACTGLPAICISQVHHQELNIRQFQAKGIVKGYFKETYKKDFSKLLELVESMTNDNKIMKSMSVAGKQFQKGQGIFLIGDRIEGMLK